MRLRSPLAAAPPRPPELPPRFQRVVEPPPPTCDLSKPSRKYAVIRFRFVIGFQQIDNFRVASIQQWRVIYPLKNARFEQNNLLPAVGIAPNIGNMPTFDVNAVDWDELYRGEAVYAPGDPGWNIGEMQPEIAALHRQGRFESPILDSGCGVGLTSLKLADHGYQVVGLDLSGSAIDKAQRAAAQLGLDAIFNTADLTADTGYHNYFNTVIDGLVFHCLPMSSEKAMCDHWRERSGPAASSLHLFLRPRPFRQMPNSGPGRSPNSSCTASWGGTWSSTRSGAHEHG